MDLDELKDLIQFLANHDIEQLEFETEQYRIMLRKPGAAPAAVPVVQPVAAVAPSVPPAEAPAPAAAEVPADDGRTSVKAPMVGTFYRAPAPDAEPYVQVGDIVEPGQPLCIIEAMKLMNEIEAEFRGRVTEILVDNAQPVDYGQPLFTIEKV